MTSQRAHKVQPNEIIATCGMIENASQLTRRDRPPKNGVQSSKCAVFIADGVE